MFNNLTLSKKKVFYLQFLLMILIFSLGDLVYKFLYNTSIFKIILNFLNYNFFLFLITIVFLGILHELFHLIGYTLFAKIPYKDISIGFDFKTLYFYTECSKFLKPKIYKLILIFPLIILGILPYCIGIFFENVYLASLGLVLITSSSADIIYIILIKNAPYNSLIKTSKNFDGFILKN